MYDILRVRKYSEYKYIVTLSYEFTTIRKFDFKIALESLIFGLQTKNNFYGTLQAH